MATYQDKKKAETRMNAGLRPDQGVKVRFRERNADWLLERAQQSLSAAEYQELQALIRARLVRTSREVDLTVKALT